MQASWHSRAQWKTQYRSTSRVDISTVAAAADLRAQRRERRIRKAKLLMMRVRGASLNHSNHLRCRHVQRYIYDCSLIHNAPLSLTESAWMQLVIFSGVFLVAGDYGRLRDSALVMSQGQWLQLQIHLIVVRRRCLTPHASSRSSGPLCSLSPRVRIKWTWCARSAVALLCFLPSMVNSESAVVRLSPFHTWLH